MVQYSLLCISDVNVAALAQTVLDAIALTVKSILGREEVTIQDLMQLPRLGLDCRDFAAYLSTVSPASQNIHPETHVYVGSSWSKSHGISGLMRGHLNAIIRVRSGKLTSKFGKVTKPTRHYTPAAKHGMVSRFFVLALLKPSDKAKDTS